MCFSAGVSFGASALLTVAGIASVYIAKERKQKLFAAIPLVFAIQQFAEGLVWLSLTHSKLAGLQTYAMYTFLVFAEVVWPIWIPLSIYLIEKGTIERVFTNILLGMGISVALYMAAGLVFCTVTNSIEGHHIRYFIGLPGFFFWPEVILYGAATVLAPFISGLKWMRLLGIALITSYIISAIVYTYYITSVWCFFAAILSLIILFIVWEMRKETRKKFIVIPK